MASFPFNTFKATLLSRAAKLEICQQYHDVQKASNNLELLQAACSLYAWAYQTNVIDDTLLSEFDETELNQFGVYTGSVTINNPQPYDYLGCHGFNLLNEDAPQQGPTLFFPRTANFTLNLTINAMAEVYAMGDSTGIINLSDNAKCDIKLFNNSNVTVNMISTSQLCFQANDDSNLIIGADNVSVTFGQTRMRSNVSYTGQEFTSARMRSYAVSTISHTVDPTAFIEVLKYNRSTVNVFLP